MLLAVLWPDPSLFSLAVADLESVPREKQTGKVYPNNDLRPGGAKIVASTRTSGNADGPLAGSNTEKVQKSSRHRAPYAWQAHRAMLYNRIRIAGPRLSRVVLVAASSDDTSAVAHRPGRKPTPGPERASTHSTGGQVAKDSKAATGAETASGSFALLAQSAGQAVLIDYNRGGDLLAGNALPKLRPIVLAATTNEDSPASTSHSR